MTHGIIVLTERRETFLSAWLRTVLEYIWYATSFSNGRVYTQNEWPSESAGENT